MHVLPTAAPSSTRSLEYTLSLTFLSFLNAIIPLLFFSGTALVFIGRYLTIYPGTRNMPTGRYSPLLTILYNEYLVFAISSFITVKV